MSAAATIPALPLPHTCPLCGADGHTFVVVTGVDKQLVRCRACSVIFLDPMPDPTFVKEEFEERHITNDNRLEYFFGANRDPVLAAVASQVKKVKDGGAILDVGCAGGRFLNHFFAESRWEKWGVEPSSFAAARATEQGLRVIQGALSDVDLPSSKFDVITVIGVLLYFRRPFEDLNKLKKALRPGGILVVELPLSESQVWRNSRAWSRIAGKPRSLLSSGHLFYYNLRSLEFLLNRSGLRALKASPIPAMRQPNAARRCASSLYSHFSEGIWRLSAKRIMCGPDFLTISTR